MWQIQVVTNEAKSTSGDGDSRGERKMFGIWWWRTMLKVPVVTVTAGVMDAKKDMTRSGYTYV